MHVPVCIVGGGPAGLLLGQILHNAGIQSLVLEQRSRAYVEKRVRAGALESGSVAALREAGVGARLDREGLRHERFGLIIDGETLRIDLEKLTGRHVTIYGQTEVTRDLIETTLARGGDLRFEIDDISLHDLTSDRPTVRFTEGGVEKTVTCDFVAGCDGFHGISRQSIPADVLRTFEHAYPFGWLGILADVPPCDHEGCYATHERGFALASLRSLTRSRYYIQVPSSESVENWSDDRLWDELEIRLGEVGKKITRGPALEKSIAPLRSFVAEPMQYGRLFLAGDAAHIVPPAGAKGLNLAISDVVQLAHAIERYVKRGDENGLTTYSRDALIQVWQVERFSWWFTRLTHQFPDRDPFEERMRLAELEHFRTSPDMHKACAEIFVGPARAGRRGAA